MATNFLANVFDGKTTKSSFLLTIVVSLAMFFAFSSILAIPLDLAKLDISKITVVNYHNDLLVLLAFLTSFGSLCLSTYFAVKIFHKRGFLSLVNTSSRFNFQVFFKGLILLSSIFGVYRLISYFFGDTKSNLSGLSFSQILLLIFGGLLCICVQAFTEEIIFRGYITQSLYAATKNKHIAMLLSGILFGLAHVPNGGNVILYFALTLSIGLFFSYTVELLGGIEFAAGMHAAINFITIVFYIHPSSMALPNFGGFLSIGHFGLAIVLIGILIPVLNKYKYIITS
jgi:membrane protease YdiL (CAAX protease family)